MDAGQTERRSDRARNGGYIDGNGQGDRLDNKGFNCGHKILAMRGVQSEVPLVDGRWMTERARNG